MRSKTWISVIASDLFDDDLPSGQQRQDDDLSEIVMAEEFNCCLCVSKRHI